MCLLPETEDPAADLEPAVERRYLVGMPDTDPSAGKQKDDSSKDPVAHALGRRVRKIRDEQGFSQDVVAAAAGIDRRFLSSLETGRKNPTLRALARVADALGVTLAELFDGVPGYGERLENRPYDRK